MELEIERMLLRLIGRVDELEDKVKMLEKQLDIKESQSGGNSLEVPESIRTNADIKQAVRLLAINEKLTADDVSKLINPGWCNEELHLNFPMLRSAEDGKFDEKGYPRYWNTPVAILGEDYYICSQWFPHNRGYFEKWFKEKTK